MYNKKHVESEKRLKNSTNKLKYMILDDLSISIAMEIEPLDCWVDHSASIIKKQLQ